MNEFWTKEKLGKHPQVAETAARLFKEYAICSSEQLLARLQESVYKFGNVAPIAWKDLLTKANLDDCLRQEYVTEALKVTTAQPAIGKGEFLLVSLFSNIGFTKDHGDLIDLTTKKRAEVKGIFSAICNGYSDTYRQLTAELLRAIFAKYKMTPPAKLDKQACKSLEQFALKSDADLRYILTECRNTSMTHIPVINSAMSSFRSRSQPDLLLTIAGMHLYDYLKLENSQYFIAVNDKQFECFVAPQNVYQAVEILKHFSIDGWQIGKRGVTITLK